MHFRWMGFLQQFHLVINYKKGIQNKFADMLSRPPISASIVIWKTASIVIWKTFGRLLSKLNKDCMNGW